MNTGVTSLKINPKTNLAYGSIDMVGEDNTVYDHVIMASDMGPARSILQKTLENYKSEDKVTTSINYCLDNYLNKMNVCSYHKYKLFTIMIISCFIVVLSFR